MNISRRRGLAGPAIVGLCLLMVSCSSSPRFVRSKGEDGTTRPRAGDEKHADTASSYRPSSGKILLTLEGVASYYAHDFHGKLTSNGERYDMNDLTAAHRTFPFGTRIRVTNLANSKVVMVRVNDRGPFVEGRIIDLSLGAAKQIDLIQSGTSSVRLEVLQWGDGK